MQKKKKKGRRETEEKVKRREASFTLTEEGEIVRVMVKMDGVRMRKIEEKLSKRRRFGGVVRDDDDDDDEHEMTDLKSLVENLEWSG